MSQATVTLPIDSYNRLVQQANAVNNQAMSIATKLEVLKANISTIRTPQQITDFLTSAITILRAPTVEPEALIPPEPPMSEPPMNPPVPGPKSTSAKSQA
jgi:hypothetical protein